MKREIRLALAQINCTVGDFEGNAKKIVAGIARAKSAGADIVSFPELAITGYPPEDLLLKKDFISDNLASLNAIAKQVNDLVAIIGFVDRAEGAIFNAAAVIHKGEIKGVYRKAMLPNYGVFDEKRYFKAGADRAVFKYGDIIIGVDICEDIWHKGGPLARQASVGANIIININASPYHMGKMREREDVIRQQAKKNNVPISYTNMIGGQDELVFDGQSLVVDSSGKVVARAQAFKEDLLVVDVTVEGGTPKAPDGVVLISDVVKTKNRAPVPRKEIKALEPVSEVYHALLLGLEDYIAKNSFKKVVIGVSGGIDSALVAALATDVLGKENVIGVFMPTRYSSAQSESDARTLAANLGIKYISMSIEHLFKLYLLSLEGQFAGLGRDVAEENLQARIRGNMLMALSNKFGWLVLATGNKSEMSTGYATLYGDMAGGFALIKDVPKTLVYKLAKYRNGLGRIIPDSIITKEPTAELKNNQKDSDSLPPYDRLDQILKSYVEEDKGLEEIVAMGFDKDTVAKVLNMVDRSEYKRRQAPPGIKITPKAFGKDRRMPITNKYK